MVFENALENILSFFNLESFSFDQGYITSFSQVLDYLDYFDTIFPIKVMLGCMAFLFILTVICAIVKVVLMII